MDKWNKDLIFGKPFKIQNGLLLIENQYCIRRSFYGMYIL